MKEAQQYCREKDYHFVWFCKDIERVYIGKKVDDNQKKKESALFKEKNLITKVEESRLSGSSYRANTSNIMNILEHYLARK